MFLETIKQLFLNSFQLHRQYVGGYGKIAKLKLKFLQNFKMVFSFLEILLLLLLLCSKFTRELF